MEKHSRKGNNENEKENEKALEKVMQKILPDVKPTEEEMAIATNQANEIVKRLIKIVPKETEIRVVGSLMRGTNVKGASDIDVFLLFDKKKSKETITKEGLFYAKQLASGERDRVEIKYAEHPYARVYIDDLGAEADIVPAYKIENIEEMATAVDRSPMHAEFLNKVLSNNQKDDIRLFKYLLMHHNLYGAEVATGGFSGYLCELLVYHFGSFINTIKALANLSLPIILIPKERKTSTDPELIKRFNSKFVVIDPVDPNRNVAAAVSEEALAKTVILSRNLLKKPSTKIFYGRGFSHEKARKMVKEFIKSAGLDMFIIITKTADKTEDIIWPQLKKVSEQIVAFAKGFGFDIILQIQIAKEKKGILVFFAPKQEIATRFIKGPSVFIENAASAFLNAHRHAFGISVQEDKLYALEKNKFSTLKDALSYVSKGKLKKRHKDITIEGKLIVNKLPEDLADDIYAALLDKLTV